MSDRYEEAEERIEDWLGYKHIVKRVQIQEKQSGRRFFVVFHFDNGIRVGLRFDGSKKTYSGVVELSQYHRQFGSDLEIKEDDVRAIRFMYKILAGDAQPLVFKCEEEVQRIWEDPED